MNEDTLTYNILQLVAAYNETNDTQEIIDTVKLIKKELFPAVGTPGEIITF